MTAERGARKEERCGDILNALVRCDQGLQNIAFALCKPKGDDESIEAFIGRGLRGLHHSFKHHSFKHHSFKYVPNECPMTTRGKECPYVPDEKWAMCPSCGDSLSRLGIVKGCALPHHQK